MKKIMTIDYNNYSDDMPVLERFNVRAVIRKNGRFAMQKSKFGDYKIPGGGMEAHESFEDALLREVQEETGLMIRKDSIQEIGEILEIKQDIFKQDHKYICHSLYYQCDVEETMTETNLTPSEISKGYELRWAGIEEIIKNNLGVPRDTWVIRDTRFLQWFCDETGRLTGNEG